MPHARRRPFGLVEALLSARDPGAARCVEALARVWPEAHLVAQEPALGMLRAAGLDPQPVEAPVLTGADDPRAGELRSWARATLQRLSPRMLVTGLSSPGLGLDEALLAERGALPAASLQDLDGLVVPGFGRPADLYLVSHERAAEDTRRRGIQAVAVGSLKHEPYAHLDPLALRGASSGILTFYGQPGWEWGYYERTLVRLAQALTTPLRYRAHPKESHQQRARTLELLGAVADPCERLEESLCASDVVLTISSSCAVDQLYLLRVSPRPLGCALYLFFDPELRSNYAADVGEPEPWQIGAGMVLGVEHAELLGERLAQAREPASAVECWERAQALERPGEAGRRAREVLQTRPWLTSS